MWKMLGVSAGQAALATAAGKMGQMAVESVWPDSGARSEHPYVVIKRELQIASREINEGKLAEAHERIIACAPTANDVRFWLSKDQIRKMREWKQGGQRGRRCCGDGGDQNPEGMRAEKRPTTRPVQTVTRGRRKYALYSNGELWLMGRDGYMAGYVMKPENIDYAIDNHEEEMESLLADARAEFGF